MRTCKSKRFIFDDACAKLGYFRDVTDDFEEAFQGAGLLFAIQTVYDNKEDPTKGRHFLRVWSSGIGGKEVACIQAGNYLNVSYPTDTEPVFCTESPHAEFELA